MRYQLVDHTADFGIRVFGASLEELFRNAAFGLFDQLTDLQRIRGTSRQSVSVKGDDYPDLMVNWLRELLFLWNAETYLIRDVPSISVNGFQVDAEIAFDIYDPDRHPIRNEIKAVTYYKIETHQNDSGWEASVIFDV
jgi:SHS2 domain-containing protein